MSLRLRRVRGASLVAALALLFSLLVPLVVLAPPASAATLAFEDVAAGRAHSCALTTTGYVWCWGSNNRGQLGVGDQVAEATEPVVVPGLHGVTAITAGANHTCAIVGGELFCWGANNTGQLGTGTTKDAASPQPVLALTGVTSVAAGRQHTCAVTEGGTSSARTWCWGSNSFGQLGNGELGDAPFAPFVSQQGQISTDDAGNLYVLDVAARALRMFAPTGEYLGSLGTGLLDAQAESLAVRSVDGSPVVLFVGAGPALVQWVDQATDQNGTWSVCADLGLSGCDGSVGVALSPDQKSLYVTASSPSGSAVGRYLIDAVPGDGVTVDPELQWADQPTYDTAGALVPFPLAGDAVAGPGAQGKEQVYFPLARSPLGPVLSIYGSDGARTKNVNVGITNAPCTDGSAADRVRGVGLSADGEVGLAVVATGPGGVVEGWCVETRDSTGTLATRFGGLPTTEPGEIGTVIDVAGAPDGSWFLADADHTTVLKSSQDGDVDFSWGHYPFRSVPQQVRLLGSPWSGTIAPVSSVLAGAQHSCAVTAAAEVWCWGSNDAGQVTPGQAGSSSFPRLSRADAGFTEIAGDGGDASTCTRGVSGVRCWSSEGVVDRASATDVAAGNNETCFVVGGSVACAGSDAEGQLGDGGTPCLQVPGWVHTCSGAGPAQLAGAVEVSVGGAHACAVADPGAVVYCWGRNGDHQVSASPEVTIDHAVVVSFPTGPDVNVGFEGPSPDAPEPPVTVTFSPPVDNVSSDNVQVVGHDLQAGVLLSLSGGPSGGTFDVSVGGGTATVPFAASADDVVAALEGLATVGPGEVDVSRTGAGSDADPYRWSVRFLSGLADNPPAVSAVGNALTGPSAPYDVAVTPLGLSCVDDAGAQVDCAEGPVAAAHLVPEGPLLCSTPLTAAVNNGVTDDADKVLWGGFALQSTTSDPSLPVPCPAVRITGPDVSSPDTEVLVPEDGPFLVRFQRGVQDVSTDSFGLTTLTDAGPVQVPLEAVTCGGAGGVEVSCADGPVLRAEVTPASALTCDAGYALEMNGPAAAQAAVRWGPFILDEKDSPTIGVDCDGIIDPGPDPTTVTYGWGKVRAKRALGHRYLLESAAGAEASWTFTGKRLTWVTVLGRNMGRARVFIDGDPVGIVDNYAKRPVLRAKWRYPGLGPGEHTVTVTPLGTARRRATGTGVAIDAFQVGKRSVKNPKPLSTWAARSYDAADQGTVRASQVQGAKALITFEGTRLAWRTLRGPDQGTAKITVDGALIRTVRNYRAGATSVRTVVLGNLAPGAHTATIVVTGTGKGKRTGAGTFVAIDTLDAS